MVVNNNTRVKQPLYSLKCIVKWGNYVMAKEQAPDSENLSLFLLVNFGANFEKVTTRYKLMLNRVRRI